MGQVIVGEKKHGSNWPIPGMKFGYEFDGIGNRNSATVNGRTAAYTADVANQYDERQVPGALDIRGRASTTARVTVNTEPTQRLDEYFYKALAIDNSSAPQYSGVSVFAVRNNAGPSGEDIQSETTGNLFLAKTPEVFTHDAEGNLTSDGRWNCTWDGENRLIRQETVATIPTAAKRKLEFAYDAENRRNRKQVFNWNGAAWVLQKDLRFLYDGWNLIAELDATNTTQRNFVWGLDISRTPQGAGGVGGLLAIREGSESHLPAFDGNGNVMALVKASDQSISARYEYGPFGETLVVEENGVSNPFRFSTKYHDSETGLYYYGYRYYEPVTGKWLSRDPIQERGGINLYRFVGNNGVNRWDYLGKYTLNPDLTKGPDASEVARINSSLQRIKSRMAEISNQIDSIKLCVSTVGDTLGVIPELDKFKDTAEKIIGAIDSGRELELEEDDLGTGTQAEITTVIGNILDPVLNLNINPSNRWSDLNDSSLDPLFLHEISHDAANTEDDNSLGGKDAHIVDDLMTDDICSVSLIRNKMPKILRLCCCPSNGSH